MVISGVPEALSVPLKATHVPVTPVGPQWVRVELMPKSYACKSNTGRRERKVRIYIGKSVGFEVKRKLCCLPF